MTSLAGSSSAPGGTVVMDVRGLDALIDVLRSDGWSVLGPTVQDGVIRPGPVMSTADLPGGVADVQEPGRYRLARRGDEMLFGHAAPMSSPKAWLVPPRALLWRGRMAADGLHDDTPSDDATPTALLGVRSCDVAAIGVLDRVLGGGWRGRPADPRYSARRRDVLVVAVACSSPSSTCFCTSTGTGPAPRAGYDLALTEVMGGSGHRFVVQVGSERGRALLDRIPVRDAEPSDVAAAEAVHSAAAASVQRQVDVDTLPELLDAQVEHPMWDEVAQQCLACGNCTAVCPTCVCTAVEDTNDLRNTTAERWRVWDSCFTPGFSYVHGGPVRESTASRYRHWMTHKLGTWRAQFETPGCVGCGRCITWCPVGIDITALARELQDAAPSGDEAAHVGA